MESSILKSVKLNLGLSPDYTPFDHDIVIFINSALSAMEQLGIGPVGGYFIEDETNAWDELLIPNNQLHLLKTILYLRVRMLFDPPETSFHIQAMNEQIAQFEWRISVMREEALAQEVTP